jgi:hypothetical protein
VGGIGGGAVGAETTGGVVGAGATAGVGGVGALEGAGCCAFRFAAINKAALAGNRTSCNFVFNISPPAGFVDSGKVRAKAFSKPFNAVCRHQSYLVYAATAARFGCFILAVSQPPFRATSLIGAAFGGFSVCEPRQILSLSGSVWEKQADGTMPSTHWTKAST